MRDLTAGFNSFSHSRHNVDQRIDPLNEPCKWIRQKRGQTSFASVRVMHLSVAILRLTQTAVGQRVSHVIGVGAVVRAVRRVGESKLQLRYARTWQCNIPVTASYL